MARSPQVVPYAPRQIEGQIIFDKSVGAGPGARQATGGPVACIQRGSHLRALFHC